MGVRTFDLAFDLAVIAVFVLSATPVLTGIPAHEYLGTAALVILAAHALLRSERLLPALGTRSARWGRAVLNGALLATLAVCAVSGLLVSGTLLRALGLYAGGYCFWDPLHAISAKALLALVLVHLALEVPRFAGMAKRWRFPGRASDAAEGGAWRSVIRAETLRRFSGPGTVRGRPAVEWRLVKRTRRRKHLHDHRLEHLERPAA